MSTLHHQNAEHDVPFTPPTHTTLIFENEPQQTTDAQTSYAEPQTAPRNRSRRYEITWTGLKSAVKWNDVLVVAFCSLLMVGIGAAVAAMLGKPFFFTSEVLGAILFVTVLQLKENHQSQFTGRRPLSWLISWLFRAALWFAFFALLRVMRHRNLVVLDELLAASIFATGSIVWQYWRQSRRAAKAH